MSYSIQNKVALVTGANRGIGKAVVESFLQHGARKVYLGVRSLEKADGLIAQYGESVVPIRVDYNDPASIAAAAGAASDVEVVVSNAGILLGAGIWAEDLIERFEKELEVNVYGLIHMARAFAPVLKANGGGAFVQLNSVASLKSFPDSASYPASKAAAYSFTQALRPGLAAQGTALLSVHPGPIDTDMAASIGISDIADPASWVGEGIVEALAAGDFHLFPDRMAKEFWAAYQPFAEGIIEAVDA